MRRRPRIRLATLLGLAALAILAGPARAAEPAPVVEVKVTVARLSDRPGAIAPDAAGLYRHLSRDFRYRSVDIVERRDFRLRLDQSGSLRLPTGRWLHLKPRKLGDRGVLMSVEIEGRIRTSLRIPSHHEVVIGAEPYEDGKLVVSLEPRF
jgi:hypothetical protein